MRHLPRAGRLFLLLAAASALLFTAAPVIADCCDDCVIPGDCPPDDGAGGGGGDLVDCSGECGGESLNCGNIPTTACCSKPGFDSCKCGCCDDDPDPCRLHANTVCDDNCDE